MEENAYEYGEYGVVSACDAANDDPHCCQPDSQCGLGEGDCDDDNDCSGALVCGTNNCAAGRAELDCCESEYSSAVHQPFPSSSVQIEGVTFHIVFSCFIFPIFPILSFQCTSCICEDQLCVRGVGPGQTVAKCIKCFRLLQQWSGLLRAVRRQEPEHALGDLRSPLLG